MKGPHPRTRGKSCEPRFCEPSPAHVAIRAEYSAKTAASQGERLLRNGDVQAALSNRMKAREKRTETLGSEMHSFGCAFCQRQMIPDLQIHFPSHILSLLPHIGWSGLATWIQGGQAASNAAIFTPVNMRTQFGRAMWEMRKRLPVPCTGSPTCIASPSRLATVSGYLNRKQGYIPMQSNFNTAAQSAHSDETIKAVIHAVDSATNAHQVLDNLSGLFAAIKQLSEPYSTINKLASTGEYLANDWANFSYCEREEWQGKLDALKAVPSSRAVTA